MSASPGSGHAPLPLPHGQARGSHGPTRGTCGAAAALPSVHGGRSGQGPQQVTAPGRRTGKVAGRNLSYAPIPPWGSGRQLPQRVSEAQSDPRPSFPSTEMRRAPSPLLPPLTLPGLNGESRRARWARGAAAPLCPDSAPAGDSRSASFLSSPLPPRPPSPATAPGGPRRRSGSGAVSRHFPQRRAAPIAPAAAAAAAGAPGGETQLLLAPSPCPTYRPAGEGAHTRGSAAGASGHPGSAVLSPGLLCPAAAGTQVVVRS